MKKIILINLLILLILVVAIEAIAYSLVDNNKNTTTEYGSDIFLQKIYGEKWQDYKKLFSEQHRELQYVPFVEYAEKPIDGQFLNISKQHIRSNRDEVTKLKSGKKTYYVFGGSTTFGYGVKDNETIPAYLEKEFSNELTFFNFGNAGYYSTIERIRFLNLINEGLIPEGAIFIDGLNDFYHINLPDKTWISDKISKNLKKSDNKFRVKAYIINIIYKSNTFKWMHQRSAQNTAKNIPKTLKPVSDLQIARIANRLTANRISINAVCKEYKIKCLFIQQPVPTYNYDISKSLVPRDYVENNIGAHINSANGYRLMVAQKDTLGQKVPSILWLEDLQFSGPMYVDTVHYTPAFNHEIAKEIAKEIRKFSLLQ